MRVLGYDRRCSVRLFVEREQAYERKFQQDQELAFKLRARRNKLFGLWAAAQMGLSGTSAEAYAQEMVTGDLGRHGDGPLLEKVTKDLAAKGVSRDRAHLEVELAHSQAEAKRQLGAPS
jgi:hypothetical protein